ncbi:MAG: DUF4143 domain-containing protein [Mobilicoccus sp.]|nr:DUF4143 domain-containing protein [Mobilicoccus sp.]
MDQRGYLPRHLDGPLERALAAAPVVLLDGPRGVGKTTTAARLAASSVMLPRDLDLLRFDPETFLRAAEPPVLLDEWQLAGTDLLWAIKRIVDDDPTPGRFILTGSVEPATYGPTYPLTGRAVRLVMRPMTTAELTGHGNEPSLLAGLADGAPPPLGRRSASPLLLEDLFRPGFPAARHMPDSRLFLDAYAALASQRAGEEGRDGARLLRAMQVLATLTAAAAPDQRVWDAADINKATWKHYDDLLTRIHLTADLPAYESNRLKRLTSYPKRFLADTALACALADITPDDLRSDPTLAGAYLESHVMQQLRPQVDLAGGHLHHLRSSAGEREIDGLIETRGSLIAVEVKHSARPTVADAKHLLWLRDQVGHRFRHGLVIHAGTDCYSLEEQVTALPLGLLTTALDT